MKVSTVFAIILIAVGIMAFAYQGFTYTTREKVVDLGPVHVTAERTKTLPLPPIIGVIAAVGGIVFLVFTRRKA
jgi:hypothetical protein